MMVMVAMVLVPSKSSLTGWNFLGCHCTGVRGSFYGCIVRWFRCMVMEAVVVEKGMLVVMVVIFDVIVVFVS